MDGRRWMNEILLLHSTKFTKRNTEYFKIYTATRILLSGDYHQRLFTKAKRRQWTKLTFT